ncbi:MAG: HlyD family efflux transporter periplasmic adaptor subunit [Porticoccaceae bacterium]|nr:HlyD family efflux transporter periplasmic adaptor subunit [Porticoccaceae bacterium]
MLPEGEVANKGDLVVVFEGGTIQTKIDNDTLSLIIADEELERILSNNKQSALEANYNQKRTALLLEKSRIDASTSEKHLSKYDYEKYQLEFEKASLANTRAMEALVQVKIANEVRVKKQQFTIKQYQDQLNYNRNQLKKLSGYAQRSGPILYSEHPWNGEKVFVGMTAQPGWTIAKIPSMSRLYIEAWVHEIDYKKISVEDSATLIFDAHPHVHLSARLSKLSTQPEERKEWGNDVYYRSVFSFEQPSKLNLLPGMSAQLTLLGNNAS